MKTPARVLVPFACVTAVVGFVIVTVIWTEDVKTATKVESSFSSRPLVKFAKARQQRMADIDRRLLGDPMPPLERGERLQSLNTTMPGVEAEFDPITRTPSLVQATGRFLTSANQALPARDVVGRFIDQHEPLFGHRSDSLRDARTTREDVARPSGMTTLVLNQQVAGIPVFKAILKANITKDGELVTINDHFVRSPQPNRARPMITAPQAVSLAAKSVNDQVQETRVAALDDPQGSEQMQRFTAPGLSDTSAQLTYLPMNAVDVRLGWDVTTFSISNNEMFRSVVDAESGAVLYRTSLTADISNATFRVFADGVSKKPFDSPTPMSPGHATPVTTEPAEVARNLVTLQALDTTASPNGWINDGGQETVGNNVDAHTDTDNNNAADVPRPNGGGARLFDFTANLTTAPSTYKDAVVTNLFYICNWIHDRFYQLGFTEAAGNFQADNFGRGGLGSDAVQADAQDGSGTNNANFSTPADGSAGRMQMYVWTNPEPDRDSSLDTEIIIHEYTHGLSNRLVGGGVGISNWQSQGMGEGWSDFYALCLLSDPADDPNGVYAAGAYSSRLLSGVVDTNYYFGIRRYPYCTDLSKNPLTFKDIDFFQASPHTGVPLSPRFSASNSNPSAVHNQGEVWCSMLWDVRATLIAKHGAVTGNERMLQLATDAMKLCPVNPNFVQSRDAILQADLVLSGGADAVEIMTAFAKRGLGVGASSPGSNVTAGVVESFDLPDALTAVPFARFSPVSTRITGPTFPSSQSYTLTNTGSEAMVWSATKTQSWLVLSPAAGTLAAGASVVVLASVNASAINLPAGSYDDMITFTNSGSGAQRLRPVSLTVNPLLARAAFFPLDIDPLWSREGEWAFGTPTGAVVQFGARDPSSGFSGSKVFGVALTGVYGAAVGNFSYLTSGPINTTGMTNVSLRFKRWLNEQWQPAAYATIDVSNDATNWTNVWQNNAYDNITESGWSTQTYLLGAVADNKPAIYVRWGHRIGSTAAVPMAGWNIDDVEILSETFTPTLEATTQNLSTPINTPVSFTLGGTDSAAPGTTLTAMLLGQPANGVLSGTSPNLTYTPSAGFSGVDTIPFTVSNSSATSAAACVVITVLAGPPDIAVEQPDSNDLTDGVSMVNFGALMTGASTQKQFRINNISGGPLNLLTMTIDGAHAAEFTVGAPGQALLAPGQFTYLPLTWSPGFVGAKHAMLHIGNNDPDEAPFDIALTATGVSLDGGVRLVKDISTGSANINSLRNVNGHLMFIATNNTPTTTIWTSEGTPATTLSAENVMSVGNVPGAPVQLTSVGSRAMFYSGSGSGTTLGLWTTDGTIGGSYLFSGKAFYFLTRPNSFMPVGSTVFFSAGDVSTQGAELWKTNGSDAGTVLVKDINTTSGAGSSLASMKSFNGELWFTADDGVNGAELWKSDGTTVGTAMVLDIFSGATGSSPSNLTVADGTLFFIATTSAQGRELWKSNGTVGGTTLVKDIFSGTSSSALSALVSADSTVFFAATDGVNGGELWKSDGTAIGTVMVKDIWPGSGASGVAVKLATGGTVYFTATDGTTGAELWKTDGTVAGTALVKDIWPGPSTSNPQNFVQVGSMAYFTAADSVHGVELWRTDGTSAGTEMVSDVNFGSASSSPANLTLVGSQLFFTATVPDAGTELFVLDLGPAPEIAVEQPMGAGLSDGVASVDFGALRLNTDSVVKSFLIKNLGTQPLVISEVFVEGADAASFTISPALVGTRIQSGGSATVGVTFRAVAVGTKTAGLHIISNDLDEASFDVALTASGVLAPEIALERLGVSLVDDVSSVMIGDAQLGLSVTQSFAIRNIGSAALSLTGLNIDGSNAASFTVGALSDSSLAPGGSSTFSVTFMPSAQGAHRAELHVLNSDADEASFDIGITGVGSFTPGALKLQRDLNQQGAGTTLSSGAVFGTSYYYAANTSASGTELWKTDGTVAGTVMVKEIAPGTSSSSPANFTLMGGLLYFSANDGTNGTELWKSDGTSAGTVMVKNINTTAGASSSPGQFVVMGGVLYFSANDGSTGTELWKSDGTMEGTAQVKDVLGASGSSFPSALTVVVGTLFFSATDGMNGTELWKSDGTSAGTVLVKDINATVANTSSSPANLRSVGSLLLFTATDGVSGTELWRSDGTAAGTVMVMDISPGSTSSSFFFPAVSGGLLYFMTQPSITNSFMGPGQELWRSDGSTAGTFMVADIRPGSSHSTVSNITSDGLSGVFFSATNGVHGLELWHSDSSLAGTAMVKDINPGSASSSPVSLSLINGVLYFSATTAANGAELWRSDGTEPGTWMLREMNAGEPGGSPVNIFGIGSTLIFSASNGSDGAELWAMNATGTAPRNLREYTTGSTSSSPANLRVINGLLCFMANDGFAGNELWTDDGTGPVLLKDIKPGIASGVSNTAPMLVEYSPENSSALVRTLYFTGDDGVYGGELWKTDGSAAGTVMVKDIFGGASSSTPSSFTNVSGRLFFAAASSTGGNELWTSDGTEAGTLQVANINTAFQGSGGSFPANLTAVGATVFFSANDGTNGTELWKSDGSTGGTILVKNITTGSGSTTFGPFFSARGLLFFVANDGTAANSELWVSDGTSSGTFMLKDINPTANTGSSITSMTGHNDRLFFNAFNSTSGNELWMSDGTMAGTVMLKDINPGSGNSVPSNFRVSGGTLYFTAANSATGTELWKTDGTAAGTVMVKDILPGTSTSVPSGLADINGTLYLSAAASGTEGAELWKSDGTSAGTVLVVDVRPGASLSSSPSNITLAGGRIFFSATGSDTGVELFSLDISPRIIVEQPVTIGLADGASTVDFGLISPGGSSQRTFTLRNTGFATLYFQLASIDGPGGSHFALGSLPAFINAGSSSTFTLTLAPASPGAKIATLHLLSDDPVKSPFDISLTGIGITAEEAWRQQYFGSISNTGDAADDADPDGDGISNLMEFALNANPGTSSVGLLPVVVNQVNPADGEHYLTISYRRRIVGGALAYVLRSSSDLGTWTPVPGVNQEQIGSAVPTGDGVTETVNLRIHPSMEDSPAPRFIHLSVTSEP